MSQSYANLPTEIKANGEGSFTGYGSVFGNVDLGGDIVVKGAFEESLSKRAPAMLFNHDSSMVAGVYKEAFEDDNGLVVRGSFADTELGKNTRTLVKMGAVTGLSIGFTIRESDYTKDGLRLIKQADLFEVSLVAIPMNEQARVNLVKDFTGGSEREIEYLLRDAGLGRSFAKTVVSQLCERDAQTSDDEWLRAFKSETDAKRLDIMLNAIKG